MRIAVAGATGLVGSQLTALARAEGHDVVEISRASGIDLLAPVGLEATLAEVEAAVDVTACPADQARQFFPAVARNLGSAAAAAGVRRTVVLSIVGVDRSPDYDYYVAKLEEEQTYRSTAPGVTVLRATQFFDFPRQNLEWYTVDGVAPIMDALTQPVDTAEVVRMLLDLATGAVEGDVDLAGPTRQRLVEQAREVVSRTGSGVRVDPVAPPASVADGAMLPGPGAVVRGQTWEEWLASTPSTG